MMIKRQILPQMKKLREKMSFFTSCIVFLDQNFTFLKYNLLFAYDI